MKKIIILLIVFAASHLGFSQKHTIELNLKTGDTFSQIYNADISMVQSFNGQEMTIKMNIGSTWSLKVLGFANNVYDLEASYNHMKMTMVLPNGNMEFDSDKNDEKDIMSKVLGGMMNKPFSVKMTKSGKIAEVTGVENLFSGAFDSVGQVDDMQKKQILDQVMQSYGDKAFKGNLEMSMAIFPESKVSKGDSWTINTKLESQMTADIQTWFHPLQK
ncbi:MAG: DUF6263 family protein [Cyclobacteriaceae bacterium]|nr:DUF6263 family protein [Cyclobacteriaceae bacterium]